MLTLGQAARMAKVSTFRRKPPGETPVTDLALRLAVAETKLKSLKDMVVEPRPLATQAERLALSQPEPERAIALPGPTIKM